MAGPDPSIQNYSVRQGSRAAPEEFARRYRRRPIVLVADDDPSLLRLVKKALELAQLDVWLAASGREAIELYQLCGGSVAVVLLDIRMTEMDGLQTASALREINPDVSVGFMTADYDSADVNELFRQSGVRSFRKPFHLDELVRVIWEMVDESRQSSAAACDEQPA